MMEEQKEKDARDFSSDIDGYVDAEEKRKEFNRLACFRAVRL